MPKHLDEVKERLAFVAADKTVLDMLLEFERTLDNANVYAYQNWMCGELVSGPDIERYWMTCKFMYPHKLMPDPMGGMRLQKYGCKVTYEKDILEVPVKITGNESYADPYSKSAKLKKHPVWIVTIQMPKKFIDERLMDEIEAANSIAVDTDDISGAYDEGVDEVENMDTGLPDEDIGGDDLGGEEEEL